MAQKQKLELTWIGKENRPRLEPRILLEDSEKSYHAKQRVSENDIFDNRLILGDNLLALKALEQEFAGRIKCVYIDPPFNTRQAFEHYDDGLEHSLWLSLMRDRLELIRDLLSESGSLFIHIDDNEVAYLIALTDEIFGRSNRVSVISFKQSSVSGPKAVNPGLVTTSNFILYYAKDRSRWMPNRVFVATHRDKRYNKFISNFDEHFSEWRLQNLRKAFVQSRGLTPRRLTQELGEDIEAKLEDFVLANAQRVVRTARVAPEDVNSEARDELLRSRGEAGKVFCARRDDRGDYYFLNGEQLIFYLSKTKEIDGRRITGEAASTIWDDLLSNNLHKEGGVEFPNGKKPELLLKRILDLSTKEGDWVLDSFAGSGTTGAVAHKMRRRWIMVELGEQCRTHIVPRMRRVVDGADRDGASHAASWKGGGGFRYHRLAPSMLEKDDFGNYIVSRQYNAPMLAEAMCKQMGFTFSPSDTVYWQQGRSSENDFIYVTTQTLSRNHLTRLSAEVGEHRSLMICCYAYRGKVDAFPNLTLVKIPRAVLERCEWGKDDYSLNVANLPAMQKEEAAEIPEPNGSGREARRNKSQIALFAAEGR